MNYNQASPSISHPPGQHHLVRGHKLWVEEEGEGPPVLLLSGFGPAGSHLVFHAPAPSAFARLAETNRVIYVDLFGRGRSEHPADLREITFASDVADVAALIDSLDLKPVHIYGFSYGGILGQALALDHPQLVRSLFLANTLHSPEMWQLNHQNVNREIENQLPEVWSQILALRKEGVPSTDAKMQAQFGQAVKVLRFFDPDNASRLLTEPGSRNLALYPIYCGADVDFIIGNQVPLIPDFRPRLQELKMPVQIVCGRFDRALHPRLQFEYTQFAPQAAFRILERSGSFSHLEEPELIVELLRANLQRG